MIDHIVLDASVFLSWYFPDKSEQTRQARQVLELLGNDPRIILVVPAFFHIEIARFLVARRRHPPARFGAAALDRILAELGGLPIETRLVPHGAGEIARSALRFGLQVKDVPYFSLAQAHGWPLATTDGGLRQACQAHGVAFLDNH